MELDGAMTTPVRLQLSRQKGFDLQAHSLALNGLPAINCARPGPHGNPWRAANEAKLGNGWVVLDPPWQKPFQRRWYCSGRRVAMRFAVWRYRRWANTPFGRKELLLIDGLYGKNLACWCAVDAPHCHVDVLLELANEGPGDG